MIGWRVRQVPPFILAVVSGWNAFKFEYGAAGSSDTGLCHQLTCDPLIFTFFNSILLVRERGNVLYKKNIQWTKQKITYTGSWRSSFLITTLRVATLFMPFVHCNFACRTKRNSEDLI